MSLFLSRTWKWGLQKWNSLNGPLLLTMIALTQNRFFALKPLAIIGAMLFFGVREHTKSGLKLHRFYFTMAGLCLFQIAFLVRNFTVPYLIVGAYALGLWLLSAFAFKVLRSSVGATSVNSGIATLNAYFFITVLLTVVNGAGVVSVAGVLNPYQNAPEPLFGVSSGDHLSGLYGFHGWVPRLGDFSGLNAAVMALFTLWFFIRSQWLKALTAGIALLFTVSNLINLLLLSVLGGFILLKKQAVYWKAGAIALVIIVSFYAAITPGNFSYVFSQLKAKFWRTSSNVAALPAQVPAKQEEHLDQEEFNPDQQRGKVESFLQTHRFLPTSPGNTLLGAGPGRFSSMVAVLANSGPTSTKGRFFAPLNYSAPLYRTNHGYIAATIRSLPPQYHSVSHSPASEYNRLLGEYGLLGALLFGLLYVWSAFKGPQEIRPVLFLFLLLLFADYFFEALCLVPLFEWMLLLSQKQTFPKP